jgi:uncharacterized membrane protein YecN with MAPEG domain
MMTLSTTALYAGLLGLMHLVLAMRVGTPRTTTSLTLGRAATPPTAEAERLASFVAWVPMGLVLLALGEVNGFSAPALHGAGVALVLARVLHAAGIRADGSTTQLNFGGATLTSLVVLMLACGLLVTGTLALATP